MIGESTRDQGLLIINYLSLVPKDEGFQERGRKIDGTSVCDISQGSFSANRQVVPTDECFSILAVLWESPRELLKNTDVPALAPESLI